MKQGDLSPVVGSLKFAIRDLRSRWDDTREVWSDEVARRFQEQHIEPLDPVVQNALKAIDRLGQVLVQAYEACSPERDTL